MQSLVRAVIEDPTLSYRQRVQRLAGLAEESLDPPEVSDACAQALDKRVICDMYEGNAPYRPRYVLPDYSVALTNGSAYLELPPATDLDEALAFLLCLYSQVPSITGYPVYLGDLDRLLAPFVDDVDDDTLHRRLRLFWISLDRMLPDAFVHADLGPDDCRVARAILRLERELLQVVPNLTLRVDPERTPDDLLLDAVLTVFECGKPHFVSHPLMCSDHGEDYAAVSCYNSLRIGGGSHTLVRVNLKESVLHHDGDTDSFLDVTLPFYVELTAELMEARIRHLVERARFYEHSWLVDEGLISLDRFSAMFGVFGLAECVDLLMEREGRDARYGHHADAERPVVPDRRTTSRNWSRLARCRTARPTAVVRSCTPRAGSTSTSTSRRGPASRSATSPGCSSTSPRRPAPPLLRRRRQRHPALRRHRARQPAGRRRRHPRRLRHRDARLHLQPRQQRVHPDHRLPRAQVRPRAHRARRPAREHVPGRRRGGRVPRHGEEGQARHQHGVVAPSRPVTHGLLADVVPFSWVDGPGNRYVAFLQGCGFDCLACHNPHTIPDVTPPRP